MTETPFDAVAVARVSAAAEEGLLAALDWMPYLSDVEGEAQTLLALSLGKINAALRVVRAARHEASRHIVAEAVKE